MLGLVGNMCLASAFLLRRSQDLEIFTDYMQLKFPAVLEEGFEIPPQFFFAEPIKWKQEVPQPRAQAIQVQQMKHPEQQEDWQAVKGRARKGRSQRLRVRGAEVAG
eukprot:6416772-Amphidinium_carterae.2